MSILKWFAFDFSICNCTNNIVATTIKIEAERKKKTLANYAPSKIKAVSMLPASVFMSGGFASSFQPMFYIAIFPTSKALRRTHFC